MAVSASKSIKWLGGLVAILVLYVAATWMTSRMAQAQIDTYVARLQTESQGQLRVADRKSTPGLFISIEDITVAFTNPILNALLPKGADGQPRSMTFHNVILHGPLPGFTSFGIARVDTTLLLTDDERKSLIAAIGTDEPVTFTTTMGWTGGTHMTAKSPVLSVKNVGELNDMTWQGMRIDADFSPRTRRVQMDGAIPGLNGNGKNGDTFALEDARMHADLVPKFETLFVGEERFSIATIKATSSGDSASGGAPIDLNLSDLTYAVKMDGDDTFVNTAAQFGIANFVAPPTSIQDMHVDVSVRHLHGPSVAALFKAYQELATRTAQQLTANAANSSTPSLTSPQLDYSSLKTHIIAILEQQPELVVDRVGFATKDGAMKLTGRVQLMDIAAQDFEPQIDMQQLMNKLHATADLSLAQGLVDHWPTPGVDPNQMRQSMAQLEEQGLVARKGDQWISHLEFKNGALTANGKPVGGQSQ